MMEEIDFELCLSVEKHAAISRREKKINSSLEVDKSKDIEGGMGGVIAVDGVVRSCEEQQDNDNNDSNEPEPEKYKAGRDCPRSNKRARISVSGSWREGDQTLSVQGPATGERSYQQQRTLGSTSEETINMTPDDQDCDGDEDAIIKTNPTTPQANSTSCFTIYEDSDDRQIRSLDICLRLPEGWHSCPGDNKENTEDDLHDGNDGALTTPTDEFQSSEESDETNHRQQLRHQNRIQHLTNITDYQPDGMSDLSDMDVDSGPRLRFTHIEFAGADTDMNMEAVESTDNDTSTINGEDTAAPAAVTSPLPTSVPPQATEQTGHQGFSHQEIEIEEEEEMPRNSFRGIQGAMAGMSFLGAPPRRLLGRSGGRRRVHWFTGV